MEKLPEIATKISAVTVYRDGARVERNGTITLEPGVHRLRVPKLTQFLDKESVRVQGRGHASIISFDTVDTTVEVTGFTKLDDLVKRKEELERQKQQIERELSRISEREKYFMQVLEKSAVEFSRWIPAGESDVAQISALETLTTSQLKKLAKTRAGIQDKLEAQQKELAIVKREITKLRRTVQQYEVTNTILLNVEVEKAGKCDFNITYFVRRAAWMPSYDIDLKEVEAQVTMFSVVRNNTLEDWEDVRLTVSTASSRPAIITEPHPYLLREYVPPPPAKPTAGARRAPAREKSEDTGAVDDEVDLLSKVAEEAAPAEVPPPVMAQTTATAVEVGGVFVFVLPEPVKIPADGEPHQFRTSQTKLATERKYFWNATDFAEAIEVTTVENGDSVMLPGKAKVYSGEDYLGETVLKVIAPHEKVDVGTRFTYDLKVKKKLVGKGAEKSGLTRGKVSREYRYELVITSFRKKLSLIKVMDRIPHSDSEIIKVGDRKISPKPDKDQLGVLTWDLEIPAEGEVKIAYRFDVEFPRGTQIVPPLP
ncbi:MAG: mucoidy inhibitor MuiA family protein [Promethearchaeota archaeon]